VKVAVIGAGIVGVATAYELALRGVEVTLIEAHEGAALATSFANGGQLSACEVAPWAGPEIPGLILRWLGRDDAPFRLRPKMDPDQWRWLLRFLMRCRASARLERIPPNLALALLTRERMASYEAGFRNEGRTLDFDRRQKGILRIFSSAHAVRMGAAEMETMTRLGVEQQLLTPAECVRIEPALASALQRGEIAGGLYSPSDASGDAHLFSKQLADATILRGVTFLSDTTVEGIVAHAGRIHGVATSRGAIDADAVVVAAGAGTAALLKPLGFRTWIYPVKGYSVTLPAPEGNAPEVSITDEARKIVISRLGNRLRAAGQAEVGGYDLTLEPARANSVLDALMSLLPQVATQAGEAEFWCGLRPMTPDGSPVIGRLAPFQNLFINSGHGTLGWTLGAGSATLLADLICGGLPQLDVSPFSITRF
jgi:D-amino-acid dehydrogenase